MGEVLRFSHGSFCALSASPPANPCRERSLPGPTEHVCRRLVLQFSIASCNSPAHTEHFEPTVSQVPRPMNNSIAILLASEVLPFLLVCAIGDKPSPTTIVKSAETVRRIQRKTTATLTGRVTYAGAVLPTPRDLTGQIQQQGDRDHCLKGDTLSQEWIISRDKG